MTEYTIEQLIDPNDADIAIFLNLFREIPGRTCYAANYLEYLDRNWINVGIFVCRKDGKIVGFTQAEAPSRLDPKCAWLPFSRATSQCPHKQSVRTVELATEWMRRFGATKFKVNTVRNVRAFGRAWGMYPSKEVLMEKDIT